MTLSRSAPEWSEYLTLISSSKLLSNHYLVDRMSKYCTILVNTMNNIARYEFKPKPFRTTFRSDIDFPLVHYFPYLLHGHLLIFANFKARLALFPPIR
jgi:hypothetical protein